MTTLIRVVLLKVSLDLRGCPQGKNSYARHFGGGRGGLCVVGRLNKCGFRKKMWIAGFFGSAKESHKQPRK